MTSLFIGIQAALFLGAAGCLAAALLLRRRPLSLYLGLGFLTLLLCGMLWGFAVDFSQRPSPSEPTHQR